MAKQIGYAVVGLGHISQKAVLPAFAHCKRSKLVAVVSSDRAKAQKLARKFGAAHVYLTEELDDCLANPEVQAVFLASVNGAHASQTLSAAAAGKHVLCEKPMANTVEDCLRMVEACRRYDVRLMIAYRKYFEPASVALKRMIDDGKLGRLRLLHSSFTYRMRPGPSWHTSPGLAGGGSLVDIGVYCVNTIRWLVGQPPSEVSAHIWNLDERFTEVDENIAFQLRFPGGIVALASSSFAAAKSTFLHVHGEEGWATLDPAYAYDDERRLLANAGGRKIERHYPVIDEFALELDGFADCVLKGRDPEPDGMEGARDVAVMQALYNSARSGRPVSVPKLEEPKPTRR